MSDFYFIFSVFFYDESIIFKKYTLEQMGCASGDGRRAIQTGPLFAEG